MDFKSEIVAALEAGKQHEYLRNIVLQFKAAGGSQRETYDILEGLWFEYGYDNKENEGTSKHGSLECLIERVWYGDGIWQTGLSSNADSR